ncbi:MAG: hypothetical protein V4629_12860 [Pseudomonadota bacterium]
MQYLLGQNFLKWSSVYLTIILTACGGGTGQDEGNEYSATQIEGTAIDGYLARASVFLDLNNNMRADSFEPKAITDDKGFVSFNPNSNFGVGENYCAANATPEKAQFCLKFLGDVEGAVIRISGGYDLSTGVPFKGTLSHRIREEDEVIGDTRRVSNVITPLTTIFENITDVEQRTQLLTLLDLTEAELRQDFLNPVDEDGDPLVNISDDELVNEKLTNLAQKIHKVVSVLSNEMDTYYTQIGEDSKFPKNSSALLYRELAKVLVELEDNETLNDALTNSIVLQDIVDEAEEDIRALYATEALTVPTQELVTFSTSQITATVSQATSIPNAVDAIFIDNTEVTKQRSQANLKAIEVLTEKIINQKPTLEIQRLSNLIINNTNGHRENFLTTLEDSAADVSLMEENDFLVVNNISADLTDFEGLFQFNELPFENLNDRQLKISDDNLEGGQRDAEVVLFFTGEDEATTGSLVMCLKYIDQVTAGVVSGTGNTTGYRAVGQWSILPGGHSVIASASFEGVKYQTIIKLASSLDEDDTRTRFLFDYDGDLANWYSQEGVVGAGSLPETNQDCKELLPTRIGVSG